MAKPRVFVSSTYYDLKHIRNSLEAFIESLGYESILFENGDIPFHHDVPLDESCYSEIRNAHIFVLIIGGKYGTSTSEDKQKKEDDDKKLKLFNSITKKEYETARDKDLPIFIFIERNVLAEYYTYKKNRNKDGIEYAHVDNVNIFKLIDDVYAQKRNNLIKEFEKFDDISAWLKEQWAGLFCDFISRKSRENTINELSIQIKDLRSVSSVLREYTESIMREMNPTNLEKVIVTQNKRLREQRIDRFAHHPMIDYLLREKEKPHGLGPATFFDVFNKSKDVKDFLKKANFTDKYINSFMENNEKYAINDYKELKNEFNIEN